MTDSRVETRTPEPPPPPPEVPRSTDVVRQRTGSADDARPQPGAGEQQTAHRAAREEYAQARAVADRNLISEGPGEGLYLKPTPEFQNTLDDHNARRDARQTERPTDPADGARSRPDEPSTVGPAERPNAQDDEPSRSPSREAEASAARDATQREYSDAAESRPVRTGTNPPGPSTAEGPHGGGPEGPRGPGPNGSDHTDRPDEPVMVNRPDLPADGTVYGRPIDYRTGEPPPLFDGPPSRDQAQQGDLGDCGVMSTMGAIAEHRPEAITNAITANPDGTYNVRLHETRFSSPDRVEPTGQTLDLQVTPAVPVDPREPGQSAYADQSENGTAWAGVMEKATAGVDQTWDAGSQPAQPERGYARLDKGSDAWDRAELLTQVTGESSVVRTFDKALGAEAAVEAGLRTQLEQHKPILVGVLDSEDGTELPHRLIGGHAYEVTDVDNGQVHLRNPWGVDHPASMSIRDFLNHADDHYTTLE